LSSKQPGSALFITEVLSERDSWEAEVEASLEGQRQQGRWNKTRAVYGSPEGESVVLGDDFLGDPGDEEPKSGGN
jgi:hypothetical protein